MALVILGERVNSASGDGRLRALPGGIEPVNADQNFELSLSSLRSANAEVSLLSSLISSVRKNVSEELSVSKSAQAVSEAYPRDTKLSADLEQYLADAGRPVSATELGVDGSANINGKSYIAEMESLEAASQEFLNIMRQLFAEELDSVAERQQEEPAEEEQKEVAKEETEKPADGDLEQEVADAGGFGSPWLGLLGLAGAGGGGGGGFGIGGFGIGGGVIDGYVSGATVFWDINSNFIMDAGEAAYSTTTGADGSYSLNISSATGQIVVMDDGVDISTGGSVGMMAMSVENATDVTAAQITPLTMLAAQGIDESTIFQMLGVTDTENLSIDSLDPVELLESGDDGDMETGGLLLLQAQQIFAITNAVAALAEESGMTQDAAVSSTMEAFGNLTTDQLNSLVGEIDEGSQAEIDANDAIQAILNEVVPDFSASASDLSSAIVKTNQVLGEELSDPTQALGESARAAALVTQNDLVTEFKAVGQMDPATAASDIADKLSASFSSVDAIKTNFQDVYKEQIAAQSESGGGIITSVDDISVLAGTGQLISVADIIGNDRNTGEGDLRLISIAPAKMTFTEVQNVMTSRESELESGDRAHSYEVAVDTSGFSVGDYVKLDIGPIKVQTQIQAGDTELSVATRLVNKFGTMFPGDQKPPFSIELADDGSAGLVVQQDSQAELTKVKLMRGVDESGADFTARIVDIAGEQYVQVDSSAAESGRLNYVVANDDGIGHGMVRLSIEPEFREVAEPVGRTTTVTEDGLLSLAGQFELTGNYTAGVQEKLLFQLDSAMPDGFRLYDGETYTALTKNAVGTYPRIQIDADNPPSLAMPENYHGDISYGFGLGSRADTADGKVFTAKSATDSITTSVTAAAEARADQATLGIFVGDDTEISADLSGAIIPVVSDDPNANQTTRIQLTGGDPNETHSVTFSNIPDGMTVTVGGSVATVSFGTLTIEDVPIGTEIPVQFTASQELLGSQFGLTDPADQIRAVVTGEERGPDGETVLASGQGTEVEFQFDIGGSFGLNVSARALTVSDEDVAALLGSLDASVGDGAKLLTTITLDSQDVSLGRMTTIDDPSIFTAVDPGVGYVVTVDGVNHTVPVTRVANDDGTLTFTFKADSDEIAAAYLEGIAVLPTTDHFKGAVTATVAFDAIREITSDGITSVIPLASAEKGPLTVRFDPVPDGVSAYDAPDAGLTTTEDHSISLASLFLNSDTPIASYLDTGETLYYEVSSIPSTARLVDGSSLTGLTGDALQSAIADAPLIGRVVGDTIQLTIAQAQNAHLVVSADAHLDPATINLAAFTREPSTGDESAKISDSVGVEITAVADAPYLSYDGDLQTRGLVNAENSGGGSYLSDLGLSDKAQVSIPATVSLEDLDGSESLWVWLTPYAYESDGTTVSSTPTSASEFSFDTGSLAGARHSTDGDAFVVKGSDLDEISVSRDASYLQINGFDGVFRLEAVSLEGAPATAADAITARSGGAAGTDYAVQSADLKVQFLQPATTPTLDVNSGSGDAATGKLGFTMEIGPSGTTDVITILATDVPEGAYFVSLADHDGDPATAEVYTPVGAKAEVPGVWVLPSNVFMDSGVAQTVYLQLPGAYTTDSVVKFTAYAVDELGLTSAQSVDPDTATTSQLSITLDTNVTVTDPVMVDVAGDGLQFTSLIADGERADQFFDLTGDGTDERLRAWLAPDSDDAFLVTWDGSGDPVLLTEYLDADGDPTTNAVEDLVAMAGTDGYVNNSDFSNPLYLWFDQDTDGEADLGEMQALNFTGQGIDVSQFDDVIVTDTATGSIIAASSVPGVIEATYGVNNLSLADAVVRDVFLPVDAPSIGASISNMGQDSILSGAAYYEDNPDGFELAASLENPETGQSWKELFGLGVNENYPDGTTFLLTVRAKTSGTTFNLSDGARLEGEPTDTWLVASWDGGLPSETDFSLKMFVQDDLSGEIPLEFRATKVFTSGGVVQQDTVVRDVTLDIAARAELPSASVPENIIGGGSESDAGSLSVNLAGIVASSPDPGETVEVVIRTTKAIADVVDFELKGSVVQAIADPNAEIPADGATDTRDYLYTLAGPIVDGDLIAKVDQYAAGTFSFVMDVTTTDGEDTSTLSGLPFQFKVAPVAQQAEVSVSATSSSEADGSLTFSVDVGSVDTDGSEFVSQISLSFALTGGTIHPGTETDVALVIGGESYAVTSTSAGNYSVTVPGDLAASGSLSGQLSLPSYFDGSVSVSASAVTVESSLLTETATSETKTDTASVDPVSDGLAADGLTLSGTTLLGSESVTLDQLIQVQTLDPDETVNIQIAGVPGDATPKYLGGAITDTSYNAGTGVWTLSGLTTTTTDGVTTVQGLDDYSLQIADLQTDFALNVEATTADAAADPSTATSGIIYIDARPLFSPEFVDTTGETLGAATLNINEDGSGVLSGINVLVGNQLNPTGTEVRLSLDTTQVPVSLTASVLGSGTNLVPATSAGIAVFTLTAAEIARGVEFSVDPNDAGSENLSGAFGQAITLQATTDYGVAGTKTSDEFNAGVNVNPTVDGVVFSYNTAVPVSMTEDGTGVSVDSLFGFPDTSEVIDSLVVGQSASLSVRLSDGSLVSLADGPFEITDLQNVSLVPVANANGASRLQLTANVRDVGENGAEGSSVSSQTTEIAVDIAGVNDNPIAVDDTLTLSEDASQTLFDVLANDTDVDGDILQLQAGSVRITSTIPGQNSPAGSGLVEIDADTGRIAYKPATDFFGTETIVYTIQDGNGGTDSGTLAVTVLSVDEPPKISARTGDLFDEDTGPHIIDVVGESVNDPDGDTVSLVSVSTDGLGTVLVAGNQISYQPAQDFDGSETLTFTVSDGTSQVSSSFEV
ncbi:MAG: Ig-like domain-containing protein, partial [Candidatus Nanopelagicales bacterium]|nr:Ig-like domain-containing protein [Candidatus Nanopelagicales bacterium]